jgi:hypothetical protein
MFMIPGLSQISTFFVCLGLALITGFGTGWYTKGQFVKADMVDQVSEAQEQSKENLKISHAIDVKVTEKVDATAVTTDKYVKEIRRAKPIKPALEPVAAVHIPASLSAPVETPVAPSAVDCADPVLTVGAVRLLNDALAGRSPDPAGYSNAKDQAPSDVGLQEVSEHLVKVAGQYHQLGARHDALVTWTSSQYEVTH